MKRVILVVVDSLGIGAMDDVYETRPQDAGANTFRHLLDQATSMEIPHLEILGINQLLHHQRLTETTSVGSYGVLNLEHQGADSYLGHQEIMGTKPKQPLLEPFAFFRGEVVAKLLNAGHKVVFPAEDQPYILVDDSVVVADNIETDYGQIYNVTAPLDLIPFEQVLEIGQIVRSVVKVNRVIALGGEGVHLEQILGSIETRADGLVGVNSPKSGVYNKGYVSRHLGYGVDPERQISAILARSNVAVTLIGKMQDVIECQNALRVPAVATKTVMQAVVDAMAHKRSGLIAATVQETDLAGHGQDVEKYATKLMLVDAFLGEIIAAMEKDDILVVTADHGNDPTIGFSQHTREKTFLLVYGKQLKAVDLGERSTLSDIAATIADYFRVEKPENGTSFLRQIIGAEE